MDEFAQYVSNLHREKDAVYGDSWKRRGETVAILANIARKVDRLGVGGAGDTSADTAIDLLVYLLKYRLWLAINKDERPPGAWNQEVPLSDGPDCVDLMLAELPPMAPDAPAYVAELIKYNKDSFEKLLVRVEVGAIRYIVVSEMINACNHLARVLWAQEQENGMLS